jgi:hypothetical protein
MIKNTSQESTYYRKKPMTRRRIDVNTVHKVTHSGVHTPDVSCFLISCYTQTVHVSLKSKSKHRS